MVISVHSGHGASNSKSCGAVGLINESDEARKVKNEVIRLLKQEGHTVYDTTVDYPNSASDCLNKIVANCNKYTTDLDVSIHFNSGANDKSGNGKSTGTEVFVYNSTTKAKSYADRVVNKIASLGFKNRGVKYSTALAVLKTKNPCMLVECCFVDDLDDVKLYNYQTMAKAIVEGILNKSIGVANIPVKEETKVYEYAIVYKGDADKVAAEILGWGLKDSILVSADQYKEGLGKQVLVVGGGACAIVKGKKEISGLDRYETVKLALQYLGK